MIDLNNWDDVPHRRFCEHVSPVRTLYNVYKYLWQVNRAIKEIIATDNLNSELA